MSEDINDVEMKDEMNEVEIEVDVDSEETAYAQNQTSEELSALMEKEGLTASPDEDNQQLFIEEDRLKSLLESILFSSPKPMTFDAIKSVFKGTNIKSKQLRRAMEEYAADLASQERGVYIEEVAGGYQLRTKIENAEFLKQVVKQRPFRISGPSMEVLAIIAYKQPCIKAEVDTIRGVESGHLIRVLMDKGLLQFDGKSDLPGKPMLYKTTKKFLEVFGLRNIRELPSLEEIDQLIPEGIGGEDEEKTTLDDLTGELSLDYGARDAEAEEEFSKITDRLSEITTSSEYFEQEKERQRQQRDKDKADDIRERMIMGQSVDEKEINWLKRYEDRLIAVETAPVVEAVEAALSEEAQAEGSQEPVQAAEAIEEAETEEMVSVELSEVDKMTDAGSEDQAEQNLSEQQSESAQDVADAEDVSSLANAAANAFKAFDSDDESGTFN